MRSITPARILALAALLIAVTQAPELARSFSNDLDVAGKRTAVERELEPAVSVDVPANVLTGAAGEIPEGASFHVVVGDNLELTPSTRVSIEGLLRYWLQPRRFTDLQAADWVIAYGASTETLGLEFAREIEVYPGVVVAEVARG